ncbi:MAG: hypothetical protein EXX96DRAFT_481353, partial [Benjaminiella poitrasii]
IKVKATEEIQDINIYGRIRAIKAQLTNRQKLILHTIAKYRAAGVTQYDLSKELNMDTKVIHYNIKRLDQLNLIFKQKAYASKMSTRLLVLQRFKAENEQIHLNNENTNTNVIFCLPNFEETVKLKLTETKDKMMTLSDLIKSLGITDKRKAKWAKCQIMEMHKRRVLERIVASDGKRQSHCVRLLEKEEEDASPRKLKETSSKSNDAKLNYNIYRDLPSYHTLYKDVLAASDKGFTTQDMAEKYPSIDPVFFQLFFKKATIPSEDSNLPHCLYRIEEREKRTLLLHHSLTSESEEVKRYIDDYSLDKYMMSTIAKTEKLKLVSVDKIPEVEGQSGTGSKSKEMGNQDYSEYGKWRLIARENGWIASKWLRAREIHESLFEYYDTHGRNQAIDLNVFWRTVRLRTIMKIYGLLPYNDPIFADFLKTESNRNISLNELPLMVKNVVSKQLPKIRYSARESIAVLKALELISIKDEDRIGIQAKLILCDTGVVKNYTLKERPEKLRMQLKRKEDRQEFWEVLQAYCTKLYAEHNTIDDKNDPLFNITLRRTWSVSVELTKNQKLILDSFVDMDAQTVPNEDDISLYNYIMKKTNLSANRIKLYYYSVLVSFDKYNKKKDRIARKKYLRQSALSSPTIEKLMKASKKKNKVESLNDKPIDNNPFMVPTFVGSRPFQKVRNYPQVARPAFELTLHFIDKYIKDIFSETEKNLLLHAYVIMRSRSKFSIFRWQPITKVITKHTAERCRRVISSMQVKDPNFDEKINKLTTKWTKYYKEGISKKELKDEKPWDCKNYDLPVFLEYFIGRLMKEDRYQELEIARREKLKRIEELQIRKNKIREKQLMQKYPFALSVGSNEKNSDMPVISSSIDINKAHLEMVVVIIKMIIMTDQNNYSPEDAFLTLREYSNEIIDQALEILKEKNIIIFDKTRYGRIPGRHINVSNKFLELISGTLPHDHFENGKEYYNKILTNDKLNIEPSDLDSGSMLTLLQLAFEEKIEINLKDADKYLENKIHTPMPKRREAQARKEYLFSYFDLIITRKATLPAMNAKKLKDKATNNRFMLPTSQQIVEYFKPNTPANPSKQIYEIICTFEDKGATFAEIMEKAIMSDTSYTENRVIEVLEKLLNSSPPIIQIAGLNSLRYITSEFAGKWLLYNKQSSTYIPPLMWNETNGNVIETALEGFGNTVISHILDNPGISFASLSSKLKEVSTKYELYHTLSYLLKTEKIISRKIVSSGKRTLFSKQSIEMVDVSNMAMISNGLTCYWLAPKYYFV